MSRKVYEWKPLNGGCDALTACVDSGTGAGSTCGPCPAGFTGDGTSGCVDYDACAAAAAPCAAGVHCEDSKAPLMTRMCGRAFATRSCSRLLFGSPLAMFTNETTKHIPQEVLTLSQEMDECECRLDTPAMACPLLFCVFHDHIS